MGEQWFLEFVCRKGQFIILLNNRLTGHFCQLFREPKKGLRSLTEQTSLCPLGVMANGQTCVFAKSLQSCLTVCDPMDCSQSGSSVGFSRRDYWSGLPCLFPGDLPNPEIKTESPVAPALQSDSLLLRHRGSSSGQTQP